MEYKILEELREIKALLTSNVPDKYLDMRQAVEYTSLSESTIRRAINKGELMCSQKTGKLLFKHSSLDKWLDG